MKSCLPVVLVVLLLQNQTFSEPLVEYFKLPAEPLIRIGLVTNAGSVSITSSDSQLVAFAADEPQRYLGTDRVTVSARAYRPPTYDQYIFEIQNVPSANDANEIANDVRLQTGETAQVSVEAGKNTWKVWVGAPKGSKEEADAFKTMLAEKGVDEVTVVTETKTVVSNDAVALSWQVRNAGKSDVRSLVKTTGESDISNSNYVDPNLREVMINGPAESAKYSSLKSVSFGSFNDRLNPVRLNGKAYRGKLEVFVNARGSLTVVNVVPLEDYLLGVVPSELSLPELEAQKAQAVAARTYAVANVGTYGTKGFDMVPTVWSQVYKGVSIESPMGTRAVRETRGIVATYQGKPIMAYFTSTCGGRTENSENIFESAEPYLRGVECSIEGRRYFDPFTIRTVRVPARVRSESNLELVRLMSILAVNGFSLATNQMSDEWFEREPTVGEISNWLNQIAARSGKTFPNITKETAKPAELARLLSGMLYPAGTADTLLTDSDVNYQLAFDDAAELPAASRADVAMLLRDGFFALRPDMTLQPNRPLTRGEFLRVLRQILEKRKWTPTMQSGQAKASVDGKLVVRNGRSDRQLTVRPDVFLFRMFGTTMYPVKEAVLIGGENVRFQTDPSGNVIYLEVEPTEQPTSAENMSPFTNWTTTLPAGVVQSRLSRYVRGIGTLYDVNVKRVGYSRRPIEIEIVGSNGLKTLKGGAIRSALRLREQLFVMNKKYSGTTAVSYTFTGRGWGHGVGMCQYGAYGFAKMGVKYDEIIKHYYTGVDLTQAY